MSKHGIWMGSVAMCGVFWTVIAGVTLGSTPASFVAMFFAIWVAFISNACRAARRTVEYGAKVKRTRKELRSRPRLVATTDQEDDEHSPGFRIAGVSFDGKRPMTPRNDDHLR